jgi:hypothetical protein
VALRIRTAGQTHAALRGGGRIKPPAISVVLTVRDGADAIDDQLAALARQTINEHSFDLSEPPREDVQECLRVFRAEGLVT